MSHKSSPVAMGVVMGGLVVVFVVITKWRFMRDYELITMP